MDHAYPKLAVEIFRLSLWLTGLVVLFVPLERLFAVHPHKIFRKGIVNDLCYYFLSSLVPAMVLSVPISLLAWTVHRIMPAGFLAMMESLPLWARAWQGWWPANLATTGAIAGATRFPSSGGSIPSTIARRTWISSSTRGPIRSTWCSAAFAHSCRSMCLGLGSPVNAAGSVVPALVTLFGTVWGFFIHSNVRWRFGPLEWVISTPMFHHWHHTRTGPINRNFSSNLPFLDALFGSLYLPNAWPDDYGIKAPIPDALVDQLVYPLFPPPAPAPRTEATPTPVDSVASV